MSIPLAETEDWQKLADLLGLALCLAATLLLRALGGFLPAALFGSLLGRFLLSSASLLGHSHSSIKRFR